MANVTKDITSDDSWTDAIKPNQSKNTGYTGVFGHLGYSIIVSNSIVTIQRSFDSGNNWQDVNTFEVSEEGILNDPTEDIYYRIGIASGDYDTGSPGENVEVGLYK